MEPSVNKPSSASKKPNTLFSSWVNSHWRALQFAAKEFIHAPLTNALTIIVIGVALALPLGFFILIQNLQHVDAMLGSSTPTISLYLKSDITDQQATTMAQQLRDNKAISQVTYISPEQGLATFEKNTMFGDAAKLFQKNPIPGVIVITPEMQDQDAHSIQSLYQLLKQSPAVDIAQLDMDWVTRLFDVISIGKNFVNALSVLFGFGVILIIGHALRSSLSAHATEIQVMKLIGATNAYIRRPLLYRGILYGLLSGIIALLLVTLFLSQLETPISQLANTYQTTFALQTISFSVGFSALFISSMLGLISAWLIITQFLNLPEQVE
jgi:cell division transport system permease protein